MVGGTFVSPIKQLSGMIRNIRLVGLILGCGISGFTVRAEPPDTTGNSWLKRDRLTVRTRSLFMATDNQPCLTDSYAWGVGVGVGYRTPRLFKHVQLGGTVFVSANVLSSDLAAPDPETKAPNRYEVGLFNLQNPGSYALISRVEELYARCSFGKRSSVVVGRQLLQTPFINPQDGRLSPTFVEGVSLDWSESGNTRIHVDYLLRMAPRSTVGWHRIGESIGLYPAGLDVNGKPSQYAGNTQSAGIVQLGLTQKMGPVVLQVWDTHVQNVFNLTYLRADVVLPTNQEAKWLAGIQIAREWAIGNGGNAEPAKAYMDPDNRSTVLSGRIGYQLPHWTLQLNATRITAEGRFLLPREWGREPFYTFLMRERNEGFGNVTAVSTNVIFNPVSRFRAEGNVGYYSLPDVKNWALNKYGMPSYIQMNLGLTYRVLKRLDTQVLWVHKTAAGNTYDTGRYIINKVGMSQYNVVVNYNL